MLRNRPLFFKKRAYLSFKLNIANLFWFHKSPYKSSSNSCRDILENSHFSIFFWYIDKDETPRLIQCQTKNSKKVTLPETNSQRLWKSMVGRWNFLLGWPLFGGYYFQWGQICCRTSFVSTYVKSIAIVNWWSHRHSFLKHWIPLDSTVNKSTTSFPTISTVQVLSAAWCSTLILLRPFACDLVGKMVIHDLVGYLVAQQKTWGRIYKPSKFCEKKPWKIQIRWVLKSAKHPTIPIKKHPSGLT